MTFPPGQGLPADAAELTGQFAVKPAHGHSTRGLQSTREQRIFTNHGLLTIHVLAYICTLNLTLILTLTLSMLTVYYNRVMYPKSLLVIHAKFYIKHFGDSTCPRIDQSAT